MFKTSENEPESVLARPLNADGGYESKVVDWARVHMDEQRQKNLQGILRWSLQQQEEGQSEGRAEPIDTERRRWLKDALESLLSQPSETDVLKAALTVLRAHAGSFPSTEGASGSRELSEDELDSLVKSFEEVQYLVEDLDHAKDLIPLDGIAVITQYLHHSNHTLSQSACEIVAIATQSNPACQKAFLPCLPRLLEILDDTSLPDGVRVKALYAISCLTREYNPGILELVKLEGIPILLHCLQSDVEKIVIKSLFVLMSYFSPATDCVVAEKLQGMIPNIVTQLIAILRETQVVNEVLGQSLALLSTLVTNHPLAAAECQRSELGLPRLLAEKRELLKTEDRPDLEESLRDIMKTCLH